MNELIKELRDNLFSEYFKDSTGIRLEDLMKSLKNVINVWRKAHKILEENVEYFDDSSIIKLKAVNIKGKKFLVIKERVLNYLIIDLDNNTVLNKEEALLYFKENYLIENFGEVKSGSKDKFEALFSCLKYRGDIGKLIDFYVENAQILNAPSNITYRVKYHDGYSFLSIHLSDGGNVLAFRTYDQRLYEHLFFNNDLEPLGIQDAGQKMGYDKMKEMFSKIKDIRVPINLIPESLRQFIVPEPLNFKP